LPGDTEETHESQPVFWPMFKPGTSMIWNWRPVSVDMSVHGMGAERDACSTTIFWSIARSPSPIPPVVPYLLRSTVSCITESYHGRLVPWNVYLSDEVLIQLSPHTDIGYVRFLHLVIACPGSCTPPLVLCLALAFGFPPGTNMEVVPWLRRLVAGLPPRNPKSRPCQFMWDLLWVKWHWERFFSEFFGLTLSVSFHRGSSYSFIISEVNSRPVVSRNSENHCHAIEMKTKDTKS
jgi:hypothetical protein